MWCLLMCWLHPRVSGVGLQAGQATIVDDSVICAPTLQRNDGSIFKLF